MIQINPYNGNVCWWCSSIGDSREHRHKKTDFKRVFGDHMEGEPCIIKNDKKVEVQGPSSGLLKFKKVLCADCNTTKSQPFDRAYDRFIIYIENNLEKLINDQVIDFSDIFISNPLENKRNVIRYYLKHLGCRLASNNISIEPDIIDFMNGSSILNNVYIKFEVRMDMVALLEKMKDTVGDAGNLFISPLRYIKSTDNSNSLELVYSYYNYQWFRIIFFYSERLKEMYYEGYNKYNDSLIIPLDCLTNNYDVGNSKNNNSNNVFCGTSIDNSNDDWIWEYLREDIFIRNEVR